MPPDDDALVQTELVRRTVAPQAASAPGVTVLALMTSPALDPGALGECEARDAGTNRVRAEPLSIQYWWSVSNRHATAGSFAYPGARVGDGIQNHLVATALFNRADPGAAARVLLRRKGIGWCIPLLWAAPYLHSFVDQPVTPPVGFCVRSAVHHPLPGCMGLHRAVDRDCIRSLGAWREFGYSHSRGLASEVLALIAAFCGVGPARTASTSFDKRIIKRVLCFKGPEQRMGITRMQMCSALPDLGMLSLPGAVVAFLLWGQT